MRIRTISFVLTLLCSSCAIYFGDSEESITAPPCESHGDCHASVGTCEANACIENRCSVVDLRDPNSPSLVDDKSGLPIGKWCMSTVDGGVDAGHDPPVAQCENNCDCFDDNACTIDICVGGQCQNNATDGGCGGTIGLCRGTWCCTGETACFQAYDNNTECENVP
ncbi:hypothetical protein EKK58_05805 [Candidatus Dependentiae bacterium]|nr:MAG: hypothetical protein EKK58_05805 [Candidatus Dependentiae bacterium]